MIVKNIAVRPEHLPARPLRTVGALYNREQMEFVLQRERARCDRSGKPMALVAFRLPAAPTARQVVRLRRVLSARVRLTDEVGWLDDQRLAAVLPGADEHGARRLAHDVSDATRRHGLEVSVSVMRYPCPPSAEPRAITPAAPDGRISRQDLLPFVVEGLIEELLQDPSPPGSMKVLLVRPLPWWKRGLDILGASTGLLLFSPVFLLVAIAIKLTSRGPAIFTQKRAGLGGRPFVIYKFRTMTTDAESRKAELRQFSEQDGPAFKMTNDPRVTRIGKLLRSTSLDELPQLWNVLKGDMSLVGPRPLPVAEAEACEQWHQRRHDVTPGLTCLWQVEGRSSVSFTTWMRMDVRYVGARNFLRDLKLILMTIPSVLLRKGAR